jgi:hypothetical protein
VIEPSALVSAPAAQWTGRVGRVTELVGDHRGGGREVAAGAMAGVGSAAQQTAGTSAHAATCVIEVPTAKLPTHRGGHDHHVRGVDLLT